MGRSEDEHRARAVSFGAVAEVYDRSRPEYPLDAVRWLVGPGPKRVADVGAGTGKLSRVLLAAGHEVVAVEPSEPMLARLHDAVPTAAGVRAGGEVLPLADASVDAVTYAQAWHWVDPVAASAEAARVLRPGGVLGLVWNLRRTDDPLGAGLAELIGEEDAKASRPWAEEIVVGPQFAPLEAADFPNAQRLTREELVGLVASRSYVALMASDERQVLLEEVAALHDRLAVEGLATLRYHTSAHRARLTGATPWW
ncbi:MAG TPA: class I SAM-dependent methyltransferase [Actinomycetes bacterium]|nr:class I SAM-dependent methyltransferase [Actinomycetes bacterium]